PPPWRQSCRQLDRQTNPPRRPRHLRPFRQRLRPEPTPLRPAQAQGARPVAARRFPLRLPSHSQRGSGCPALSVLPQTALRPTRQQPLPPPPRPPAPAGQQARSRLPPRRQRHSTDRRSAGRLIGARRLLNSSCLRLSRLESKKRRTSFSRPIGISLAYRS